MALRIAMIGQKGIPANTGGVERHVEQLSVSLVQRGHAVTVYTRPQFTSAKRKQYKGVSLVSLRSIPTKNFDAITHTLRATLHAVRHQFDIIHYHGVGPALVSFLPRLLSPKTRVVVTFHSIDRKHQKWGLIARTMLQLGEWAAVHFPHKTITVSQSLQHYCDTVYGRPATYVPNGIGKEFTAVKRTTATIKTRFGLEPHEYILVVTRLIPHKGVHLLIKAFRQVRTTKKLVIVGDGYFTDDYVQYVHQLAEGDSRILFTGTLHGPVLAELYTHAYLFVLPSEAEGLATVLLEAASMGTCILASNIPENLEVLQGTGFRIGYTFQNRNQRDLQKQLQRLVRNPSLVNTTAQAAKAVVRRTFNWTSLAAQIERVYTGA